MILNLTRDRVRESQRLWVKASRSIFRLATWTACAKNSMTQFCLLLLLVAICIVQCHNTARSVSNVISFERFFCCCLQRLCILLSDIIYYSQMSRILLSPLFRGWLASMWQFILHFPILCLVWNVNPWTIREGASRPLVEEIESRCCSQSRQGNGKVCANRNLKV